MAEAPPEAWVEEDDDVDLDLDDDFWEDVETEEDPDEDLPAPTPEPEAPPAPVELINPLTSGPVTYHPETDMPSVTAALSAEERYDNPADVPVQFQGPKRRHFINPALDADKPATTNDYAEVEVKTEEMTDVTHEPWRANLVSSLTTSGKHAPVIDFDLPIEVLPSSTLGHYHLYIHKEIEWEDYQKLLDALLNAGLIENGFKSLSEARGASFVRPLGASKPNAPRGVDVLVENARLRHAVFELSQENATLREKFEMDVNEELKARVEEANQTIASLRAALEEAQQVAVVRSGWS